MPMACQACGEGNESRSWPVIPEEANPTGIARGMQIIWDLIWWIVLMAAIGGSAMALLAMWRLFTGGPGDDVRR